MPHVNTMLAHRAQAPLGGCGNWDGTTGARYQHEIVGEDVEKKKFVTNRNKIEQWVHEGSVSILLNLQQ